MVPFDPIGAFFFLFELEFVACAKAVEDGNGGKEEKKNEGKQDSGIHPAHGLSQFEPGGGQEAGKPVRKQGDEHQSKGDIGKEGVS